MSLDVWNLSEQLRSLHANSSIRKTMQNQKADRSKAKVLCLLAQLEKLLGKLPREQRRQAIGSLSVAVRLVLAHSS